MLEQHRNNRTRQRASAGGIRRDRSAALKLIPALLLFSWTVASRVVAQDGGQGATPPSQKAAGAVVPESAGPEYRSATEDEQLQLLRRLLGVEEPTPAPVVQEEVSPEPKVVPAVEPAPAAAPAAKPKPVAKPKPAPKPKPVAKPKPAPKPKPVARPKPAPKPAATPKTQPASAPAPAPTVPDVTEAAEETTTEPVEATGAPEAADADAVDSEMGVTDGDLPPIGSAIDAKNVERWSHLLPPSIRWAVRRGARMDITEARPIVLEPERAAATERYHAQVRLAADKRALVDYVAGIPFPQVTGEDPDAAIKLMFNVENRLMFDDVDGRNFGCITGSIDVNEGVKVERDYRVGHFRRLFYTGRLRVDPKPTWKTPENVRYRESIFPINEPFDFKGSGVTYSRYSDPARQDDSWLYFPQTKRVRRLSTAQRSEGVFGQDVDLDSYTGFAGNPAWFEWQLLGKKTLLAPFHALHQGVKWNAKPADFLFDDGWEAREFYIIAARSLIPGYNFSLRILYVDVQSMLIPYTEVYDHDGQLWRAYVQQWKTGLRKGMPYNTDAVYDVDTNFIQALTVFDMQQEHSTRCEFPAHDAPTEETWYYWRGDDGGSVPEDFDVANFIAAGR